MNDIPVEKKLELVQQVRSQYRRNQSDLMNREQILYGRNISQERIGREYLKTEEQPKEEGILLDNTFCIRLALSCVLLITFILLDQTGKGIAGIHTDQIAQVIASDFGEAVETWGNGIVQSE